MNKDEYNRKKIMKPLRLVGLVGVMSVSGLFVAGCGTTVDDETTTSPETVSEIAGSTIAGATQASESGGTMAFLNERQSSGSILASIDELLFSNAKAANAACPLLSAASCSGSIITLNYTNCSFGSSAATWSGSQILTFTSGACTTTPQSSSVTFTRTFGAGTARTGANGVVITLDSANASGWSSSVSGGTTVIASGGNRTITVNGLHLTATKTFTTKLGNQKTVTVWDHSVSTPSAFTVTGSGHTRTVTGGSVQVQHNLAKFIGTATIAQTLTFSAGCCHPTGGKISTTLSGGQSGTETLTYNGTCGQGTLVDSTGASSTITLSHCL